MRGLVGVCMILGIAEVLLYARVSPGVTLTLPYFRPRVVLVAA